MAELARERSRRGLPPVELSVGINTGVAMAGNMGSSERLNYTVLGESVNLASRVCQAADGGEILVTGATLKELDGGVKARSVGARTLKGFSRPVELFRVEEPEAGRAGDPPPAGPGRAGTTLALLAGLLGAWIPGGAAAQAGGKGLPTLADLGAVYVSQSGAFHLSLPGRADFELYRPQESPPWMIPETDPFVAGRARLFAASSRGTGSTAWWSCGPTGETSPGRAQYRWGSRSSSCEPGRSPGAA